MPKSSPTPPPRGIPGTRRDAREWAVQILFALDAAARGASAGASDLDLSLVFEDFWEELYRLQLADEGYTDAETDAAVLQKGWRDLVGTRAAREYCEGLVEGVALHLAELDAAIQRVSDHWALDRMGGVERSALRVGAYELLFRADDVPRAVAINEAIDVCKYFGMRESARFVNGVLDQVARRAAGARKSTPPDTPDQPPEPPAPDAPDDGETWSPSAD